MRFAVIACAVLAGLASPLEARIWSARSGSYSVEAEFVRVQDGNVVLRRSDGQQITVPLAKLSLGDLHYIETCLDAPGAAGTPSASGVDATVPPPPLPTIAAPLSPGGSASPIEPLEAGAMAEFEKMPMLPRVPMDGLIYGRPKWHHFSFVFSLTADFDKCVEQVRGSGEVVWSEKIDTLRNTRGLPPEQTGTGTGFVVHPDGYLVTCAHVVESAAKITVRLGEHRLPGRVVCLVPRFDLAVVRVPAKNLRALPLREGADPAKSESVRAIGFPVSTLLGSELKATRGTIVDIPRRQGAIELLQVDAAVNPGNSGGPLVDERGQVVGVVHAKRVGPDVSKVGFAVPVSRVRQTLAALRLSASQRQPASDLPGSELLDRVAPSVAILSVKAQPPNKEDQEKLNMGTTCSWTRKLGPKPLPETQLAEEEEDDAPPDAFGETSYAVMNRFGQTEDNRGAALPYLLVMPTSLLYQPLSPDGAFTWQEEKPVLLALSSPLGSPRSHHAAGLPLLPTLVPWPSSMDRIDMLARFDHPGVSSLLGKRSVALARTAFEIQDANDKTITIRTTFSLKPPEMPESRETRERVPPWPGEMDGTGLIVFSRAFGVIQEHRFQGTLKYRYDDKDVQIPITLRCQLEDPETTARRLAARNEAAAKRRAERKAAEEAWAKLSPEAKITQLLAEISQWKSDLKTAREACGKLAGLPPLAERRQEVLDTMQAVYSASDTGLVHGAVLVVFAWTAPDDRPGLIRLLDSEKTLVRFAAIAERLKVAEDRLLAESSLPGMGSVAQKPVLALLSHGDPAVRCAACRILDQLGDPESLQAIERLAKDDPDESVRTTARVVLEPRRRAQQREESRQRRSKER